MKKLSLFCVLAVSVFLFASCKTFNIGPKGEGEFVEAESLVPYDEANLNKVKKEGIAAAQKNAVEQVAGVFISASTTVDHSSVVEKQILSKTEGFIRRYNVQSSFRKGDMWYTKIRAQVLVSDISGIIKENEDNATVKKTNILVASREVIDGAVSLKQDCKQAVYRAFKEYPYTMLNGDNLSENNLENIQPVIDKARYEGARFVVVADVSAYPLDSLSNVSAVFKPYRARVNLKVISSSNYSVAAESIQQISGLDPVAEIASQKAVSAACEAAAKEVTDSLNSAINSAKTYTLKVNKVDSIERLKELQSILREQREIEDFNLKAYKNGNATFEVQSNVGTAEELAAKVIRQHSASFTLYSVAPKALTVEFI